jgi:hypothetical protein
MKEEDDPYLIEPISLPDLKGRLILLEIKVEADRDSFDGINKVIELLIIRDKHMKNKLSKAEDRLCEIEDRLSEMEEAWSLNETVHPSPN